MSNKFADLGFEPVETVDAFDSAFKRTLGFEGGYTVDHAGATNFGVTQDTYDNWRKKQGLPTKPVRAIDTQEAKQLYKQEYFDKPGFSKLPASVAGVLFDYGVNAGTPSAAMALQKSVGASPDGVIGSKTLNKVNEFVSKNGEQPLLQKIVDQRSQHIDTLIKKNPAKYKKFENGWKNRIKAIKSEFKLSDLNPFSVTEASADEGVQNDFTDLGFEEAATPTETLPQTAGNFDDLGFQPAEPQIKESLGETVNSIAGGLWRGMGEIPIGVSGVGKAILELVGDTSSAEHLQRWRDNQRANLNFIFPTSKETSDFSQHPIKTGLRAVSESTPMMMMAFGASAAKAIPQFQKIATATNLTKVQKAVKIAEAMKVISAREGLKGAALFAPQAFSDTYDAARAHDVSPKLSATLGLTNAVGQVVLESKAFDFMLRGTGAGNLAYDIFMGAFVEGVMEEGTQGMLQNALTFVYDKPKEFQEGFSRLMQGVPEGIFAGALMGSVASGAMSKTRTQIQKEQDAMATKEVALKIMENNAKQIGDPKLADLGKIVVEKMSDAALTVDLSDDTASGKVLDARDVPDQAPPPSKEILAEAQKPATPVERAAQHGEVVGIDAKSGLPVIDTSVKPSVKTDTYTGQDRRSSDMIPQPSTPKNRLSDWTPILDAYDTAEGKKYQINKLDVSDTIKGKLLDHYGLLFDKPVEAAQTTTPNLTPKQTEALAPSTENIVTDPVEVNRIKSSILEGENILKAGKFNGRKLSEGELFSVQRAVNNSKAKIGMGGDLYGKSQEAGQKGNEEKVLIPQGQKVETPKAPVSPLHAEALKYKTPEEFVSNKGIVLAHNTSIDAKGKILTEGFNTKKFGSTSKKYGYKYQQDPVGVSFTATNEGIDSSINTWQGKGTSDTVYSVPEFKNPLDIPAEINGESWKKALHDKYGTEGDGKKLTKALLKDGYDAIITNHTRADGTAEIISLKPENVRNFPTFDEANNYSKSQLTAIYNEAHGIKPETANAGKAKPSLKKSQVQFSDDDIKDIKTLTDIEINMPNGETWAYNLSDSSETIFGGTPSGHSETMQAYGPKESMKVLLMAMEGKPLTALQEKKVKELLSDFRANIKPSLERLDNEIAKTTAELTESETKEVISAFENEEGINKPTSQEASNITPSGQIRPELLPPERKELFQEEGELFKKPKGDPASLKPPTVSQIKAASSPQEFEKRIEQLNKFGQANAILRRTAKLKNAAGRYSSKDNTVKIDEETILDNQSYMSVIGHELGHAIEKNVTGKISQGTSGKTGFDLFGKDADHAKIRAELIAVSEDLVGRETMLSKQDYYFQSTELIARFFEKMIFSPGNLKDLAPAAIDAIELQAIKHPIIQEFLLAATGGIDKGTPKFALLRDMRETYQKHLGKFVGNRAYDQEMVYRAMKERGKIVIEKFIKDKMKMVKDSPESLFRAAESIKISRGGVPEFGTRDFATAHSAEEEQALVDAGYERLNFTIAEDGKLYTQYAKQRYTPDEAKLIFDSLSDNGKKLIVDFTAERKDAKDFFNREVIKETYKIQSQLEGWVHHYFEDRTGSTVIGGQKFKAKVAGSRKQRTGTEGYVEDFKKAMTKALVDLEGEKVYNEFIPKLLATVTKPLGKGQEPEAGWVEVVGNLKSGVGLPIEKRSTVIDSATGERVPMAQSRYQMPKEIYERYKMWRGLIDEATTAVRIVNDLNRYWRINILFHPGTASTNYNGGALQYSTKILTDFYREVLTGKMAMPDTQANISAMLKVLLPKGWMDAPDWIYGGDMSNFYGQFMKQKSVFSESIDTYANGALKMFSIVERYWKKVIMTADGVADLKSLNEMTPEGLRVPTKEEAEMIAAINESVDLYGLDYDNVPAWLEAHQKSVLGQAIKPFAKYPYKYAKQVLRMVGDAFDQSIPWQDRISKILALATIVSAYAMFSNDRKKKQKTPVADKSLDIPPRLSTRGRLFIGTDEQGREIFTRVAKYPYFNLTEAGMQFVDGNWETGKDVLSDMLGSIGPMGETGALLVFNYRSKYNQYEKVPVILGDNLATFLPGYRILNDVSRALDPFQRKQETFGQTFTQIIPTTDQALQEKLHGKIRTERVPIEGNVGLEPVGSRTTVDVPLENVKEDILLSLFTGVYRTRLDPKVVEAYIIRKQKNLDKKNAKK